METSHVLVIHNEPAVRDLLADFLRREQVRLSFARSGAEGLSLLGKERVHVLVAGGEMLGDGDEFVRKRPASSRSWESCSWSTRPSQTMRRRRRGAAASSTYRSR